MTLHIDFTHLGHNILTLRILTCLGAMAIWLWGTQEGIAGVLSDRITNYPNWHQIQFAQRQGELIYPEWFRGEWMATSTLVEQIAPLAPEVITPGFEGNRKYLDRPISFPVRFIDAKLILRAGVLNLPLINSHLAKPSIVADRSFNGMSIAVAYLGKDLVKSVKVDPQNPTRQITELAQNRQLVSFVTEFEQEFPEPDNFIATEVSQQVFHGNSDIYLNIVETTTSYQFLKTPTPKITATQISAIYLSPQDVDYFRALKLGNPPVALYKYQLDLVRSNISNPSKAL